MPEANQTGSIHSAVVLGGGSAGFLTAVALRKLLPQVETTVVHSPNIPVIGVGESTTHSIPVFLHRMVRLPYLEFYRRVKPSWKLGLRLEWGDPLDSHFNYPFDRGLDQTPEGLRKVAAYYCLDDPVDYSPFCALMDRKLSPVSPRQDRYLVRSSVAYHIKNELFIDYLRFKAEELGATIIEGEMVEANLADSGDVKSLRLEDGRVVDGDLFFDCSGFGSQLLGGTMKQGRVDYSDALYCDSAVVGSWNRPENDSDILPYTTAETMRHGWCWRIDFLDVVTRGYVFSSAFCSEDEAIAEMKEGNPELGDDVRVIKFPSGRFENFWVGNVVGIGNSSGFVEPLEATALHMIVEQIRMVVETLVSTDLRLFSKARDLENRRFRETWDGIRDFLALHFKFNRKIDSPFWEHCRRETPLGEAEGLVEYYQKVGPSPQAKSLVPKGIFGYDGFMSMLVGQRVPTEGVGATTDGERGLWRRHQERVRKDAESAMRMRSSLERIYAS